MRDYRIDLSAEIKTMSWRRFSALLSYLHPDGVLSLLLQRDKKEVDEQIENEKEITPDQLMRFF